MNKQNMVESDITICDYLLILHMDTEMNISRLLNFCDIGGYDKYHKNISPPILYAELNQGTNKNGEPDEYLRYFLYYPGTIHCGISLESPQ